jgi:DNA polymerase-3 subunit beta
MRAAARANSVAASRTTMPILGNVLLEAEDDALTISATDLEISYQTRIPAEVVEPGRVTLPAKPFSEIVKNVVGDHVVMQETANHSVVLGSGAFSTNLFGLSPENYPTLTSVDDVTMISVDSRLLGDSIAKTISSVTPGDDTYNLAGVYFLRETEDDLTRMRLISTDTQRMSVATLMTEDLDKLQMETAGVIVPTKGLQELKALAEGVERLDLGLVPGKMVARTGQAVLIIRLLDGPFPDYHRVIPVDNDLSAWFTRKELLDAIKRVGILVSGKTPLAKFRFNSDLLTISGANPEVGKAEEAVGAEYSGPEITTGFNPTFFSDILAPMASEKIQVSMREGKVSFLVTGPEDPGFFAVIVSSAVAE